MRRRYDNGRFLSLEQDDKIHRTIAGKTPEQLRLGFMLREPAGG